MENISLTAQPNYSDALYQKNLEWFAKKNPDNHKMMQEHQYVIDNAEFDEEGNMVNILVNGAMLYPENALSHAEKQIEQDDLFSKQNIALAVSINCGTIAGRSYAIRNINNLERNNINSSGETISLVGQQLLDEGALSFAELTQENSYHAEYKHKAFVLCFGLGMGDYVDLLFEKYDISNLIIFETNIELMQHAAHIHDFGKWDEKCESKQGQLIIIGPHQLKEKTTGPILLNLIFASSHYPLADNNLFFSHLEHTAYDDFRNNFKTTLQMLKMGKGFLEDELCMLNNTSVNIFRNMTDTRSQPDKILTKKSIDFSKLPLLLVANGPSLDDSIETIREKAEQGYMIMACGSTLYSLLNYGIFPDFFVSLENSFHTYWSTKKFCKDYMSDPRWKQIIFIGFQTSSPALIRLFDRVMFVLRGTSAGGNDVIYSILNGKVSKPSKAKLAYAVPNVTNLASAAAIAIGFKEIYFFGVDLGSKVEKIVHSKKSFYNQEEYFGRRIVACTKGYDKDDLIHNKLLGFTAKKDVFFEKDRGNFGGIVFSNFLLQASMSALNILYNRLESAHQMRYQIYNCSDGRYIEATIPLRHTLVPDLAEELRGLKQVEKDRLYNHHHDIELSDDVCRDYKARLQFCIDAIPEQREQIKDILENIAEKQSLASYDFEEFILKILKVFENQENGSFEEMDLSAIILLLAGDITVLLHNMHKIFSKLSSSQYPIFIKYMKEHLEIAFENYTDLLIYLFERIIDNLGKFDCLDNQETPKTMSQRYFYNHFTHELLLKQKKIAPFYPGLFFEEYVVGYEQKI